MLIEEREYTLSVIDLSVQIFTTPSVARYLVSETPIAKTMINIIRAIFLEEIFQQEFFSEIVGFSFESVSFDVKYFACKKIKCLYYPSLDCETIEELSRRAHIFLDLHYLLSTEAVHELFQDTSTNLIFDFLDMFSIFQSI